jgi:hypothetical protein
MSLVATGLIGGLAGLVIGTFVSETIKQTVAAMFTRLAGRGHAARVMNAVVMEVPDTWEGYTYEYAELRVLGMRLAVTVTNHSDQLVKSVHVRMRRPPNEVDTARAVPAIAAGGSGRFTISRDLGLIEDAPFEEEEPGWRVAYVFEADFDDTDGRRWRLTFDPLTWTQRVAALRR